MKICGITTPGDAVMAVEGGAAAVGLVFWPQSPRAVTRVEATAIARAVGGRAALVGVFVNADAREIRDVAETVPLDAVQLHGDEVPGIVDELRGVAVIKALAGGAIEAAGQWPSGVLALVDADDPVRRGGTGQCASWEAARALAATRPVILAGGLDASNLAAAITEVGPLGVDVSSGVEEAPGRKSRARLAALFDAWRAVPGVTSAWPFPEKSAARTMTGPLPPASSPVMREPVVPSPAFGRRDPDVRGYFGPYGGRFVPETLVAPVAALEAAYFEARRDAAFVEELRRALRDFVGRPTPLYEARRLGAELGLRVLLKREDLAHTGAHKINNAVGQALLARRMGKSRIVAETGAGQHGVATATVCAWLGLECVVYMGVDDMARQALNVFRMRLLGAEVRGVDAGSRTLKDAINEAMRDWVARVTDTHYLLGSVLGPHPYPLMVREFQSVVGEEARAQCLGATGGLPAAVVASVGGGSNAMGLFDAFVADPAVRLVGVEAGGERIEPGRHAARFAGGRVGVLHGTRTLLLQDTDGNVLATHSVSAGLDYPAVGPEHAWLAEQGRAEYVFATDTEALEAFRTLGRLEGLLPALESAHAVAALRRLADTLPRHATVVVSLSGRGDKDVTSVQEVLDASEIARADEGAGHVADQ